MIEPSKMEAFKKAAWEAVKEGGRLAVCGFVGFVLDHMVAYFTKSPPSGEAMTSVALIFRMADNFWHQYNKIENYKADNASRGIIPF